MKQNSSLSLNNANDEILSLPEALFLAKFLSRVAYNIEKFGIQNKESPIPDAVNDALQEFIQADNEDYRRLIEVSPSWPRYF